LSIAQYFNRIGLQGWLRSLLDVAYTTEFGQPIDNQTALNFLFFIDQDTAEGFNIFGDSDQRYKIKGGSQLLCNKIAEQLKGQINYRQELKTIRQKENKKYELVFQNGYNSATIKLYDIVILTIPFTELRKIDIQVNLPFAKRKAIQELGYGNSSKLFLGFRERYWRSLGYSGVFFTDSFIQSGWDSSSYKMAERAA
jgi:monoamine oxidase